MAITLNKPRLVQVAARWQDEDRDHILLDSLWEFNVIADGSKVYVPETVDIADPTIGLDQDAWDTIYNDAVADAVATYAPSTTIPDANPVVM